MPLPLEYHGIRLGRGYRLDIFAASAVVVVIESIETNAAIQAAQLLTYLRLGGWRVGLLMDFNMVVW